MKLIPPIFKVDFRQDPEDRWDNLLTDSWACRQSEILCRAVKKDLGKRLGSFSGLAPFVHDVAPRFAKVAAGDLDYLDDMKAWSEYAVGDIDQVILANFSYEALQVGSGLLNAVKLGGRVAAPVVDLFESVRETMGDVVEAGLEQAADGLKSFRKWARLCTSVAFHQPGLGMVHCRNLDWPIWQMKRASVILDCQSEAGSFKAVSVPGMVGVLSGVAEGRFSITINSNDYGDHLVPCMSGWSAALLVRWIFENCRSYEEALRELKKTPAFVPFYAMVAGPGKGQAAVVEVNTDGKGRIYKQPNYPVALANHYPGETSDEAEWEDSLARQDCVEERALKCKAKSLLGCFSVVNDDDELVTFGDTVQSMVLHPRSGAVLLQQL